MAAFLCIVFYGTQTGDLGITAGGICVGARAGIYVTS